MGAGPKGAYGYLSQRAATGFSGHSGRVGRRVPEGTGGRLRCRAGDVMSSVGIPGLLVARVPKGT